MMRFNLAVLFIVPVCSGVRALNTEYKSRGWGYLLEDKYAGEDFLKKFDFYTDPDPTGGLVKFLGQDAAEAAKLAYVREDGVTVLRVDNTTDLPGKTPRDSVRISSKKLYNSGLFIFDFIQAPFGCAVWPTLLTRGSNIPNNGKIDVFEGTHFGPTDQYTFHAAPGCAIDVSRDSYVDKYHVDNRSSTMGATDCGPSEANSGCYYIDKDSKSYGRDLKTNGGAIFALEWNDEGIRIWFFPRRHVPLDIIHEKPVPALWPQGHLKAALASTKCSTQKYFKQHAIVLTTTLCGGWANGTYASSGCPSVGAETCAKQVMKGSNFNDALWLLNSISVYAE